MTKPKNPDVPDLRYADAERKRQLVLNILWAKGPLTQKEVADLSFGFSPSYKGIAHSAISNVVNALCINGEAMRRSNGTVQALKLRTITADEVITLRRQRATQAQRGKTATARIVSSGNRVVHYCSDKDAIPEAYAKANAVRRAPPGRGESSIAGCF